MRRSWQENRLRRFYAQFRVRTPKRWKQCNRCKDYFKDEPMYYQKIYIYCGSRQSWYCAECYMIIEREELREVGVGIGGEE